MKLGTGCAAARGWVLASMTICIALLVGAPAARAADSYTLDSTLSLTGSCTTTKADTVPDPGCPGGEHPPSGPFTSPRSIVTDFYGNIYVASYGDEAAKGVQGRIDIFDSEGFFITELLEPAGPKDLAVDSKGNLYVFRHSPGGEANVVVYSPTGEYDPEAGKIQYGAASDPIVEVSFLHSLAINPLNDHLFVHLGFSITEFGSLDEENKVITPDIGSGVLSKANGQGLAIDSTRGLIYAADNEEIHVFELAPPHKLLGSIDSADLPSGNLTLFTSVAVNEETGDFFIFDGSSSKTIYRFNENAEFIEIVRSKLTPIFGSEISVDNGPFSPNLGYVFAPSEENVGISFAFEPPTLINPPVVESVSFENVTQEDADLRATIEPSNGATSYVFEYTTQARFEEEGFAGAAVAGEGEIPAGNAPVSVSAQATDLSPGTTYRFRVIATNEEGSDEGEGTFTTYSVIQFPLGCSNDAMRVGPSALLPDCRAYELVTPPNTNARTPRGIGKTAGVYFTTREASPDGNRVSFITEGGTLPGSEGTGSLSGDAYLSTRGPAGWGTASAGPTGTESVAPLTGSTSPDQGYSFWQSSGEGTAAVEGKPTSYVRYPDGHSELVGRGSLGTDPGAEGKLISENGGHIIFISANVGSHSAVQLEENAPPSGTTAIYDRTSDEVTHVVSLLPGDVTPAAGQNALYIGASLDGEGVAFRIGSTLYLRHDNEETYEIGTGVTFAGIAEGGGRIFYVEGGNLFAFDVATEETIAFSASGDVTVVNVAAGGTAAYFVSPSVLTGGEENPIGATAQAGKENLYLSREGAISFVGTVTQRDVEGEMGATEMAEGLGLWTLAINPGPFGASGRFAADPSRATPDGSVLLFESRADLTGYDPEGHAQVYRYDSVSGALQCLSCNPTQASATSAASLQSIQQVFGGPEPFNSFALVNNLRADGRRAFFQSSEALVSEDADGRQDVYEWEDQGVGSCKQSGGCIYLISSGHSERDDYLYAVSDSGDDVFFRTSDLLLPSDTERTPSIYDARVGGGFPQQTGCSPLVCPEKQPPPPPNLKPPASPTSGQSGNLPPNKNKRCGKGKRRVKRHGQVRCVKKKHHKRKHRRTGSKQEGAK